jgi:pyruvate dehydrogenase E2 component (dihydrolipoamide acetyltransferase)
MATPVIMPKFGMTQQEATVVRWLRQEGEAVEQGEPLLEAETDKTIMEVEAPAAGLLRGVRARPGEVVPVTAVMAYVVQPGEALPEGAAEAGAPQRATPLARKMAAEAGIDIGAVPPSGLVGRVRRQDVEDYLAQPAEEKPRATPAARRLAREEGLDLAAVQGRGPRGRIQEADVRAAAGPRPQAAAVPVSAGGEQVLPLQGIRRTIAGRMLESYRSAPHITLTVEADMTAAQTLRAELNALAEATSGPRVSVTAVVVKVCACALRRHPLVNASLRGEAIHLHEQANIGVAVALEEGLIVPVIRQAERLGIGEIARALEDLAARARQGRLLPDDVSGGSFTVSNLGMYGIDHFTAIINPPESAILAVGRVVKRALVVEDPEGDQVAIRPMMKMTLSADHRVLDGATAAQFLQDLVHALEHPARMLW